MKYFEIAPAKIFRKDADFLTYAFDGELKSGEIVEIPMGKSKTFGVVWKEVSAPEFETKEILRSTLSILPAHFLPLAKWLSEYYATPLAEVLRGILPAGITKNRRFSKKETADFSNLKEVVRTNFLYNKEQVGALEKLEKINHGTVILHGITGSGKTAIYLNQAEKVINSGKSAIILVPEISLTSQLVANFQQQFSNIKVLHSKQTESERHKTWLKILNDKTPQIIIGARSALFAPVQNLGIIIVDEAHEPSFKQEQTPKYSALRVSSFLAKLLKIKAIFGSATPLIEDYFLAELAEKSGGAPIIKMKKLAKSEASPAEISLVDLTKKENRKHRFLSKKLLEEIEKTLQENRQVLIYHNRRGSASLTICESCGWQALCSNCFVPTTLHADHHHLTCHICGKIEKIPLSCPVCGETEIIHKGIGTKVIESELRKLFPDKKIARFDADTDKNETVEKMYKEIVQGEIDILIGTQVIAKGLDLPKLKTVGVIQADAGLALPDFTSSERNFQLLSQVAGRVGRHSSDSNVIIQTFQPDAPSIKFGISQDFEGFYDFEIKNRKKQNYPPFVYLLRLTCVYKTEKSAVKNAKNVADEIRKKFKGKVQIFGPTPAFYERVGETYRWQIIIKSKKRGELLEIAREFQSLPHWRVDLDSGLI